MLWETTLVAMATVLQALEAGIAMAFWGFVMPGLANVPDHVGLQAMNAVNRAFVKGWMLPLFLLSIIAALSVVVAARFASIPPAAVAGSAIYLVGMAGGTLTFNVPLNNALLKHEDDTPTAASAWQAYQPKWNRWNVVRSIAGTLAACLSVYALAAG